MVVSMVSHDHFSPALPPSLPRSSSQTEQHVQPSDPRKPRLFSCSGLVTSVDEPDHARIQEGIRSLRAELKGVTCIIEREG